MTGCRLCSENSHKGRKPLVGVFRCFPSFINHRFDQKIIKFLITSKSFSVPCVCTTSPQTGLFLKTLPDSLLSFHLPPLCKLYQKLTGLDFRSFQEEGIHTRVSFLQPCDCDLRPVFGNFPNSSGN